MGRISGLRVSLAGLSALVAILFMTGRAPTQSTPPPPAPPGLNKIQHFIFIMQENRSFDHYFGTYPGAEGIPPGICVPDPDTTKPCVQLFHDANNINRGGPHGWNNA